jgi:uncharacterized protein (DUF58 family)
MRGVLARRIRYRVTRGGVLFMFATLLLGAGAVVSANNLLFLILATMLSTLLVSGLVSRLCLAGLQLDYIVPEHVTARSDTLGRLYVRNLKTWMPSFSIHVAGIPKPEMPVMLRRVYFPVIPGGATLNEALSVRFPARGCYQENSFAFTTRFPFGFLEKSARVTLRREVVVYPSVEAQPAFDQLLAGIHGDLESWQQGLGHDFYRIRPYEALESARRLDWKATAHTGEMQVREFAREQDRSVELFLDRNVPDACAQWFERAVETCAYLVWNLSLKAVGVRFRSQGCHIRVPEEHDVYTILRYLATVAPGAGRAAEPPSDETSYRILFSAMPQRFVEEGWHGARVLTDDATAR